MTNNGDCLVRVASTETLQLPHHSCLRFDHELPIRASLGTAERIESLPILAAVERVKSHSLPPAQMHFSQLLHRLLCKVESHCDCPGSLNSPLQRAGVHRANRKFRQLQRQPLRLPHAVGVEMPARHPPHQQLPYCVRFSVPNQKKGCHELPSSNFPTAARAARMYAPLKFAGA